MTVETLTTIAAARAAVGRLAGSGARVALVPTMGALHEGHRALMARARELADVVVVSIFVNPLQFGAGEDLDRYPRTPDADLAVLDEAGVDLLFLPDVPEMYPRGAAEVRLAAGPVGARFEGASRPGHFDGVLTVVAKLLNIIGPDVVLFGRKDAQQAFLVRRMVGDLDFPVDVEVVATVRESDGLARSSRNRFLDSEERAAARVLPAALLAAAAAADRGVGAVLAAAESVLAGDARARVDYLAVVDPASFEPVGAGYRGPALVLVAATVGTTRLIDNAPASLG